MEMQSEDYPDDIHDRGWGFHPGLGGSAALSPNHPSAGLLFGCQGFRCPYQLDVIALIDLYRTNAY